MDSLITDLLYYATVGPQELKLASVDLEKVLRRVLALVERDIGLATLHRAVASLEAALASPRRRSAAAPSFGSSGPPPKPAI